MSKILNFWLSVLISQMPPYLMFILVSKSTHNDSLVLSSQNAHCFYIFLLIEREYMYIPPSQLTC